MQLKNPFSEETRLLFLYEKSCWLCHRCDLGLEIHHITNGRISSSVFNAFLICSECHREMCHSQQEEQKLFAITFKWVYNIMYKPKDIDILFIRDNYNRLFTNELKQWLDLRQTKKQSH